MKHRIEFLDGLRGVAILLVILFHAFTRWVDVMPYGARYARFPLAEFGHLGVQLFFLISGFVIFMTLEKATSLGEFALKRWLRLFPAMALCSTVILFTAPLLAGRPGGAPLLRDFIPGVLFLQPDYLTVIFGVPFHSLDGAFWSLYVEVQFYLVVSTAYFLGGRRAALGSLAVTYGAWMAARALAARHTPGADEAMEILTYVGAKHFAWFLAGALLFLHFSEGRGTYLLAALVTIGLALVQFQGAVVVAAAIVAAAFVVPVVTGRGRTVLSSPPMLLVGVASYPLYLLHQNITVALVRVLARAVPQIPGVLLPVLPTALLIALSWLIATKVEPSLKRLLVSALPYAATSRAGLVRRTDPPPAES